MEISDPSYFGALAFGEAKPLERKASELQTLQVQYVQGEWRPPDRLLQWLPEDFAVPVDRYTGQDGLRRLIPGCSWEELIDLGAIGGLAVLHGVQGFDEQADHSYRAMHLILQYVRGRPQHDGSHGMREHLMREFRHSRDLYLRQPSRQTDSERDILPIGIEQFASSKKLSVSVSSLTELGRRAARDAGYTKGTGEVAVAYGLYEIAKQNPLDVKPDEIPALIQRALYDLDRKPPAKDVLETVAERLLEAIHRHLEDPQSKFERWFGGPNNSLVKQIAQQKGKRGGALGRNIVRDALLELGWQAYTYVGQCLHALMRTIKNSVPEPLNDTERQYFELLHESQPYFGGMPLALLAERTRFLEPAVLAIWQEPDNQNHVRALHQMLAYYAEMVRERRAADMRAKKRSTPKKAKSRPDEPDIDQQSLNDQKEAEGASLSRAGTIEVKIDPTNIPAPEKGQFEQIAAALREREKIKCEARCAQWGYHLEEGPEDVIAIQVRCDCGEVTETIHISRDAFVAFARELFE